MTNEHQPSSNPASARFCPQCKRQMSSLNSGNHCFACTELAEKIGRLNHKQVAKSKPGNLPRVQVAARFRKEKSEETNNPLARIFAHYKNDLRQDPSRERSHS